MVILNRGLLVLTVLLFLSLIGCHSNFLSNNLNITDNISSIEVYEWDSNILLTTIKDNEWINELVKQLKRAKAYSTANMDYPLPDYNLIFINDKQKNMFSIGYYNEVMYLGVKGRYLDVSEDIMYQTEIKLPW